MVGAMMVMAGRRRRGWLRQVTVLLVVVVAGSLVVPPSAVAERVVAVGTARAAAPPPGGLVPTVENFGRTEGEFSVSDDGAAKYRLPLWMPAGRGGGAAVPKLVLAYDSRGPNGLVGVGWSLTGLSSITRCPRTIAQDGFTDGVNFTNTDAFCLDGMRLVSVGSQSGPLREFRTEQESFARITASGMGDGVPDSFKIEARDGTIHTLGGTEDSRLQAFPLKPGVEAGPPLVREDTRVTVSWSLNRVEDRNGNAATVEYQVSEGDEASLWHVESKPITIHYEPNREVRFFYDIRPDPMESFASGVHSREPQRLATVQMLGASAGQNVELLREYRLTYERSRMTERSMLKKVTECDGDVPVRKCIRPMSFDWTTDGVTSYDFGSIDTDVRDAGQQPNESQRDNRIIPIDIDGDSKQDILYPSTEEPVPNFERHKWFVRRSTGTGFTAPVEAGFVTPRRRPCNQPVGTCPQPGRMRVLDHNLDGRSDLLVWVEWRPITGDEVRQWQLFTSNGTSFVRDPSGLETPVDSGDDPDPIGIGDLDGNGTPDIVTALYDVLPDGRGFDRIDGPWHYTLNSGRGGANAFGPWVDTDRREPFNPSSISSGSRAKGIQDVNADNRMDLTGGGGGWGLSASGEVEDRMPPAQFTGEFDNGGDVNGDGLQDLVDAESEASTAICRIPEPGEVLEGRVISRLNSGNGYAGSGRESPNYLEPHARCIADETGERRIIDPMWDRGIRVVDFNHDGADDVLMFRNFAPVNQFDIQRGAQLYIWDNGQFRRSILSAYTGNATNSGFGASQVLDVNGDGLLDIIHAEGDHLRLLVRRGGQVDRLTGFGDMSLGPRVEVEYTTLADRAVHTPGGAAFPLVPANTGGSIVKRHRVLIHASVPGGTPTWDTYDHTYIGARMGLQGRGWLGFTQHRVSQERTGAVVTSQFDNITPDVGVTTLYPFAMRPSRVVYTAIDRAAVPGGPTPREYRKEVTTPHTLVRLGRGYTIEDRVVEVRELERPVGAANFETVRETQTVNIFDGFGNPLVVNSATTGGRGVTENRTFRNDTATWLIGLVERHTTTGCTAVTPSAPRECKTRESTVGYDSRGNANLTVTEPNQPALKLTTRVDRDEFGNVTVVTKTNNAGESRAERLEYNNADKLHATDTINALGHRTKVNTHSGLGVVLDTTDPNGVQTTMKYDRFGRLRETHRADGSFQLIGHTFLAGLATETTDISVSGGGRATVSVDQFGREKERRIKGFDGQMFVSRTSYDNLGRLHSVTRPAPQLALEQRTVTDYDKRNRVVAVGYPDLTFVRYEYVNRETHTIDANGIRSIITASVDGDAESSSEDDPNSTNRLRTRYEYDHFGQPSKVIAPDGTTQVMIYDLLGRRETLNDQGSSGSTTTTYTAFGEVASETNAEGRVEFQRDALGRTIKRIAPEGESRWTWDTAPNGMGKLTNARSADQIVTEYNYDAISRPTNATWSIGGTRFSVGYGYDAIGRQTSITYPEVPGTGARLKVAYVYNEHGHLAQVKDAASGTGACTDDDRAQGRCFWTAEARDADGHLVRERFGNNVVTENTYKPESGLLDTITTTGPGDIGRLNWISYGYDANRNVTKRHDQVNRRWEIYEYDELNRLERWRTHIPGPGYFQHQADYTYDTAGNLKTESLQLQDKPRRDTAYGHGESGAPRHAMTSRSGTLFGYDRAGRQTSGDRRTISYNSNNLPKSMTWAQNQRTDFSYDADGARVRKQDNALNLISVPGVFDRSDPGGTGSTQVHNIHHITVEGRVVAQVNLFQARSAPTGPVTGTQVWYLHQDQQGSTTLATNPAGREVGNEGGWVQDMFYDPFGRRVGADHEPLPPSHRGTMARFGYTGHEHDDEFGLIYMKGRMYDPAQRRFLTPDPLVQNPLSSQTNNRYAYAQNNPATYTDPTGLFSIGNIVKKISFGIDDLGFTFGDFTFGFSITLDFGRPSAPGNAAGQAPPEDAFSRLGGGSTGQMVRRNAELHLGAPVPRPDASTVPNSQSAGKDAAAAAQSGLQKADKAVDAVNILLDGLETAGIGGGGVKIAAAVVDSIWGQSLGPVANVLGISSSGNGWELAWNIFKTVTDKAQGIAGVVTLAKSLQLRSIAMGVAAAEGSLGVIGIVARIGARANLVVGGALLALDVYAAISGRTRTEIVTTTINELVDMGIEQTRTEVMMWEGLIETFFGGWSFTPTRSGPAWPAPAPPYWLAPPSLAGPR